MVFSVLAHLLQQADISHWNSMFYVGLISPLFINVEHVAKKL